MSRIWTGYIGNFPSTSVGRATTQRQPWARWPRFGTRSPTAVNSCSGTADRVRATGTRDPRSCGRVLLSHLEPERPHQPAEPAPGIAMRTVVSFLVIMLELG